MLEMIKITPIKNPDQLARFLVTFAVVFVQKQGDFRNKHFISSCPLKTGWKGLILLGCPSCFRPEAGGHVAIFFGKRINKAWDSLGEALYICLFFFPLIGQQINSNYFADESQHNFLQHVNSPIQV
jgi:hypothetical protein